MTNSHRVRASLVMISSDTPSEMIWESSSPLTIWNGRTAIDGCSGRLRSMPIPESSSSAPGGVTRCGAMSDKVGGFTCGGATVTSPTKRNPRRLTVRMRVWSLPSSPTALRVDLMRLEIAESEMHRPFHIFSTISSLVTTRSRFSIRSNSKFISPGRLIN